MLEELENDYPENESGDDLCFECGQYTVEWWLCQNTDCNHEYTEEEYELKKLEKRNGEENDRSLLRM